MLISHGRYYMANIAIVSSNTTHGAVTILESILTEGGHTCSISSESSASSMEGFDLIIGTRLDGGASANTNIVNAFNAGTPVLVGFCRNAGTGLGTSSNFLAGKLGLASSMPLFSDSTKQNVITNDFGSDYVAGTQVVTHTSKTLSSFLEYDSLSAGATPYFSYELSPSINCSVAIAPRGSDSLLSGPFPAACGLAGFLYLSGGEYTTEGKKLVLDIVDKILLLNINKTHTISGYVFDDLGNPLTNPVYLYQHSDAALIEQAIPDPTGKYLFKVVKDVDFFIVCSSDSPNNNFKIHSFVQGALV